MEIEIIYPSIKKRVKRQQLNLIISYLMAAAAYICPIINLLVGGKAWSAIVLWSLWMIWTNIFNAPLVEDNPISRTSRLAFDCAVLLLLIELFLKSGWLGFVLPIVCFGAIILLGVFFFINIPKQKQNLMPMIWVDLGAIVGFIFVFFVWKLKSWPVISLGISSITLLIASVAVLRKSFWLELKKRFHL